MLARKKGAALRVLLLPALLVACARSARSAEPGEAGKVLAAARAEAVKLSPALERKLDWHRARTILENAGSRPEPWLARGTVLSLARNLEGWPVEEQLKLLRAYYGDKSPAVRRQAVDLLARPEAVKAGSLPDLRRAVAKDPDLAVRVRAAKELLRAGDPAGWKPLLAALYSNDAEVQASKAVKASPHREAKNALIDLSRNHWKFGSNAARSPKTLKLNAEHIKLIERAWAMRDNVVRRTAVEIIGLGRDPKHKDLLVERVKAEKAWTTLRSLYVSLGYLGDKSAVPVLAEGVAKPKVRKAGRTSPTLGLAFLGDVSGLEALVKALEAGQHLPVLAKALSRAFDPDFTGDRFLVPGAAGKLEPAWIPDASTGLVPWVDDGEGGRKPLKALTAAEVHAAWKAFIEKFGPRLKWDPKACCYRIAAAKE